LEDFLISIVLIIEKFNLVLNQFIYTGCGSSSESEVQPIVEAAGNKDYNALVDTTGFSTQQQVVGPFAQLRNAIAIIERVQKLVVKWNKQ
jgi:hypothetical protein